MGLEGRTKLIRTDLGTSPISIATNKSIAYNSKSSAAVSDCIICIRCSRARCTFRAGSIARTHTTWCSSVFPIPCVIVSVVLDLHAYYYHHHHHHHHDADATAKTERVTINVCRRRCKMHCRSPAFTVVSFSSASIAQLQQQPLISESAWAGVCRVGGVRRRDFGPIALQPAKTIGSVSQSHVSSSSSCFTIVTTLSTQPNVNNNWTLIREGHACCLINRLFQFRPNLIHTSRIC